MSELTEIVDNILQKLHPRSSRYNGLRLERKQVFNDMKAAMGSLSSKRDELAHSHTRIGVTPTVQAVDLTKRRLNQAYLGLTILEKELHKIQFR